MNITALPIPMPEVQFWKLVTHIDRPLLLSGQDTSSLLSLQAAISKLHPNKIISFALRLADRLEMLLRASRGRLGPFSDDALLYAACLAIARGQAWFEASLHWPRMFDDQDCDPEVMYCESLLYVARRAWSQATGRKEDDFPIWTLEDGLRPFENSIYTVESVTESYARAATTWPGAFAVFAHFEQHPGIERTVEPDAQDPITLADFLDDYFWCLLDLGDYLGLVDEEGQSLQILYDAGKNLYWAETPCEVKRISYGQEFSREAMLDFIHRLPLRFSPSIFESPQALTWNV